MKINHENKLMSFHFGTLDDASRMKIERQLILDSEMLVNYFDLKRDLESAGQIPIGPSPKLRSRLAQTINHHRTPIVVAAGLAVAASALFFFWMTRMPEVTTPSTRSGLLFDSSSELSPSSDVL